MHSVRIKGVSDYHSLEQELGRKMHKAIAMIQFKLEGQLLRERREFHMEDRCLLHRIDPEKGSIVMPGRKGICAQDNLFPTIDWEHPYELTAGELEVMERLEAAFRNCEKLQNHMRLLLDVGGLYKIYNGNLLFHGCIPLNEDGKHERSRGLRGNVTVAGSLRYSGKLCAQGVLFRGCRGTEKGKGYPVVYLGGTKFPSVRQGQNDNL